MQPNPKLGRPPKQTKNTQDIPALRMNASVIPTPARDFKSSQTQNIISWAKEPVLIRTTVREKNLGPPVKKPMLSLSGSSYLKIPEFIPWKTQPTATVTRQEDWVSQVKEPLLPLPSISQSPGYIPWMYPMGTSTHEDLTLREQNHSFPLPMTSDYYQPGFFPWMTKPTATVTRQETWDSRVETPLLPLTGQYYTSTPAPEFIPWKKAPIATVTREEALTTQEMEPPVQPWELDTKNLQSIIRVEMNQFDFPISWTALTSTSKLNTAETGEVDSKVAQDQKPSSSFDSTPKNENTLEDELSSFLILKPKEQKTSPIIIKGSARRKRKRPCKQSK